MQLRCSRFGVILGRPFKSLGQFIHQVQDVAVAAKEVRLEVFDVSAQEGEGGSLATPRAVFLQDSYVVALLLQGTDATSAGEGGITSRSR